MGNDNPSARAGMIQIPTHINGMAREMFALVVAELNRRNASTADMFLVERLAVQLARIREVDRLVRFGYAIASAAESIKTRCWNLACEFAADLQLRPDDLERLVGTDFPA